MTMDYGPTRPPYQPPMLTHAARQMILMQSVAGYTGAGWQIAGGEGYSVTIVRGTPTNHILHLLLTIFLCGLWAPVWLLIALLNGYSTVTLRVWVDEYGQVHTGR